jgi:thioredoxin reductase (NADPH)
VVGGTGVEWLERLELRDRDGATEEVEAGALFLMIGAQPNSGWLPAEIVRNARGFIPTGQEVASSGSWPLERAPFSLETSMPGVLAVGDVRAGSPNRVASAVGEGSIAVRLVHDLFAAGRLDPQAATTQTF